MILMNCKLNRVLISFLLLLSGFVFPVHSVRAEVEPGYFTIAVLPDTQMYTKRYPSIFDLQTQWIVDNAESSNIVFVAHWGIGQ